MGSTSAATFLISTLTLLGVGCRTGYKLQNAATAPLEKCEETHNVDDCAAACASSSQVDTPPSSWPSNQTDMWSLGCSIACGAGQGASCAQSAAEALRLGNVDGAENAYTKGCVAGDPGSCAYLATVGAKRQAEYTAYRLGPGRGVIDAPQVVALQCDPFNVRHDGEACNEGIAERCTRVGLCEWRDPHHEDWGRSLAHFERGCKLGDSAACGYQQELTVVQRQRYEQQQAKASPVAATGAPTVAPTTPTQTSAPQTDHAREYGQKLEQQRLDNQARELNRK